MQQQQQQQPDDFITAVMLNFDPSSSHPQYGAAVQYCSAIQKSSDGWRLCLQKLHSVSSSGGDDQVKFWCLHVLEGVIVSRYPPSAANTLNEDERTLLRRSLMLYVRDIIPVFPPQSSFIKNKLCALLIRIARHDYPTRIWSTFFTDFIGLLQAGPEVIDCFVRLLGILDEEVVEYDPARCKDDHAHNTDFKDSMREHDLAGIVDAIVHVCELYARQNPDLVAQALEVFQEYIGWIDINLVVTERFLTLFYAFMNPTDASSTNSSSISSNSQQSSNNSQLQLSQRNLAIFATDCVIEIIDKRMDSASRKVALIRQLRVVDFLANVIIPAQIAERHPWNPSATESLVAGALGAAGGMQGMQARYSEYPDDNVDDKYAATIASLVSSIGVQLIESIEKLLKSSTSSADPASAASAAASSASIVDALPLLESVLLLGYRFLEHPLYTIGAECLDFYIAYIRLLKRSPSIIASTASQHARKIFCALAKAMEFPPWYDFNSPDDEEAKLDSTLREHLVTMFTNLTEANPPLVLELLATRLGETIARTSSGGVGGSGNGELNPATVEVSLRLLYHVAEPLKANTIQRTSEEPFRSMIGSLLSSRISAHSHPQVSIIYFEIVVRYVSFLHTNLPFIGPVLASFLDARGLRNPHPTVRARAAYLFNRCVTAFPDPLKKHLAPFVDSMLKEIQTIIEIVLGADISQQSITSSSSRQLVDVRSSSSASIPLLSFEDLLYLCESLGILISSPVTGQDGVRRYARLVFHFFQSQIEAIMAPSCQQIWMPSDSDRMGERLARLIEAVATMSKKLSHDGSRLGDLMIDLAQLCSGVLAALPRHPAIVAKVIFFTHRLIDCTPHSSDASHAAALLVNPNIDAPVMTYFARTLSLLIANATSSSIARMTDVMIQIIIKFKKRFEVVLDTIFLPMCHKIFECLATYAHVDLPGSSVGGVGVATMSAASIAAASEAKTNGLTSSSSSSSSASSSSSSSSSTSPLPAAAYSTERQDRLLLQQQYYEFLKHIVKYDLVNVFASPTNARHIKSVLDTILQGCVSPPDFIIHRSCFSLLRHLISIWHARGVLSSDAGVHQFVVRDVTTAIFTSICSPHFNLNDPNAISAVRELLELHKGIYTALGEPYLNYLHTDFLGGVLHCPPDVCKEFCVTLMNYNSNNNMNGREWKQFEPFFRGLQQESRNKDRR